MAGIAALTLLLRAMIPAGWMPAPSGAVALVLCSGGAASLVSVDLGLPRAPAEADAGCSFAAPPALAGAAAPVLALALLLAWIAAIARTPAGAPHRQRTRALPPPIGPPHRLHA